ncbi:hypothetical protein [Frigidibacter sp.]|uniref:hypothetical protein n=1 Tax=Frigidibacter sp. TaxID=2586418 RepID=UPI002733CD17|nr:hypothetical protein [Frigidibacter sp.]MDP3340636.1 hypothetical protein [Frigidibacter sp.]
MKFIKAEPSSAAGPVIGPAGATMWARHGQAGYGLAYGLAKQTSQIGRPASSPAHSTDRNLPSGWWLVPAAIGGALSWAWLIYTPIMLVSGHL